MARPVYINAYAAACPLGANNAEIAEALFGAPQPVSGSAKLVDGREVPVGRLPFELPHFDTLGSERSRTNRLLLHCLDQIEPAIARHLDMHGVGRLGVIVGTSTTGISEAGDALKFKAREQRWPEGYDFGCHELGDPSAVAARHLGAEGTAYSISTACTSGAKAISAGARLIRAGLCDSVVCAGVDTLCELTLNGFAALESLSDTVCNPFSVNRRGINIGEGAGVFLLSAEPGPFRVAGWGESSDAHHVSAPRPDGAGAEMAIRKALASAAVSEADIGYAHLHGTATPLNDQMEAGVIHRVLGEDVPCSSTKPLTGHTLGAAGAVQAAFCLMAMAADRLPPHLWDGARDPTLPPTRFVETGEAAHISHALSASYAFGGNNIALVLGRA